MRERDDAEGGSKYVEGNLALLCWNQINFS